jgi:DNA processing protein
MIFPLSDNTQVALLLTGPLVAGREDASTDLLSSGEYLKLTRLLSKLNLEPADLLSTNPEQFPAELRTFIDSDRFRRLLARGFQLSQALERWHSRAIWVVGNSDDCYLRRLTSRLKENAPPVIYGCGDAAILDAGGLAVVGSRDVDFDLIEFTEAVGRLAAEAGRSLVSGGARGIDQAAMRGALEADGKVAGVLADSLERAVLKREHRDLLIDSKLVLISPYDPSAGFNIGNAMQRNKLIYALADAALVVNSDYGKGGTWAGAVEQLEKLQLVQIYVRSSGQIGKGLEALQQKGALPWPNPTTSERFNDIFDHSSTRPETAAAEQLSFL